MRFILVLFYLAACTQKSVVVPPPTVVIDHTSFIKEMMAIVGVKASKASQDNTAAMLNRVTLKIFENNKAGAEGFVTLVAMESSFKPTAKSSAGAVGYAQVIPKFGLEFASHCGLEIEPADLNDPEINLTVGACLFKQLLSEYNNVSLSLVAYNAGRYSKQIKDMQALRSLSNLETAGYVAKYHYLQELSKQ
jgi:hypothetical protein